MRTRTWPKDLRVKIIHLLPNLVTLTSICAGLTAIRFGYVGEYEKAVQLILLACVLDGLDGRLARLLKCPSLLGAELDSLADFLNFGVAPVLIIYNWGGSQGSSIAWIAVLAYTVCCALRLARFNVDSQRGGHVPSDRFVGVPSPAGAVLVMLPMYVSFLFYDAPLPPPGLTALYMGAVGLLMISRVPTYTFKNISIDMANAKFVLLGAVLLAAALLIYLWATLVILTITYGVSVAWAFQSAVLFPKIEK
ncbi:MAG: CDP-diacylglycerol--serine O-phosphatidyltransferase [Roseobacter sp.]